MSSSTAPRTQFEIWRVVVFYLVIIAGFGVMMTKLFELQILQVASWRARADENRTRTISVAPSRGIIYDRNNYILARNVASYNIVVTPASLPDDEANIQQIYRDLSALTGVPVNHGTVDDAKKVSACVSGPGITQLVDLQDSIAPYTPVAIDCDVSEQMAEVVREKAMDWPGVGIQIEPIRDYPTGELTSDIIGFLGPIPASLEEQYVSLGFDPNRDKVGYSGVEAYYQDLLQGTPGKRVVEVDVAGQELGNLEPPIAPVSGDNLVLTIDTRFQQATEAALTSWIDYWNSYFGQVRISSGVVIAMNPQTGEILSMASYPSYENNRMARFIPSYYYEQLAQDPRRPLLNHAISDEFPPGSVFKLATAIGVLNEGIVKPTTVVDTPGFLTLTETFSPHDPGFQRQFVDWIYDRNGVLDPGGFGHLDFYHCIAYSSDVCFYKLGGGYKTEIPTGLDIERIRQYARALGYDQQTGIDLLGEAAGLVPTPQWKRINRGENWSTGDTYIATVGQGYVLATPLQVLLSAATIANNGKQMQPTVVREVTDNAGKVIPVWRDADGNLYNEMTGKNGSPEWISTTDQTVYTSPPPNAWQISPFQPHERWDMTAQNLIEDFQCDGAYCTDLNRTKSVQPWVLQAVQQGMRLAVTDPTGTLHNIFKDMPIAVAGKTGTAEYCDNVAQARNLCQFGDWPAHAWTLAYAPFDHPEIAIVAFAYNGGEGATVAAPIVHDVMNAYFELKAIDSNQTTTSP